MIIILWINTIININKEIGLGEILEIFFSIVMIIVTSVIAKRQNRSQQIQTEIAQKQTEIYQIQTEIAQKQTEISEKAKMEKNKPFLYPVADHFKRKEWKRFYIVDSTNSLGNIIPKIKYEELDEKEKVFFRYCQNNTKNVYFYYLNSKLILALNGNKENDQNSQIIIEHYNTLMIFQNIGAPIVKIHIDEVLLTLTNGETIKYDGVENNFYSGIILTGEKIEIIVDEIVNKLEDSACSIDESYYESLSEENVFERTVSATLKYKSYDIKLSLWNQYEEKFRFLIQIKKGENRFDRKVVSLT